MTRLLVAISFAIVLGLPFAFRPERAVVPAGARTLVVITPHHEQIRAEFARERFDRLCEEWKGELVGSDR